MIVKHIHLNLRSSCILYVNFSRCGDIKRHFNVFKILLTIVPPPPLHSFSTFLPVLVFLLSLAGSLQPAYASWIGNEVVGVEPNTTIEKALGLFQYISLHNHAFPTRSRHQRGSSAPLCTEKNALRRPQCQMFLSKKIDPLRDFAAGVLFVWGPLPSYDPRPPSPYTLCIFCILCILLIHTGKGGGRANHREG